MGHYKTYEERINMIALIKFKSNLVIERHEALSLKLNFKDYDRFGMSNGYGKESKPMSQSDYYTDELFKVEDENGKIEYYTDESKSKKVDDYYRYDKLKDKDWVFVEQSNNLVDLEYFALNCRFPFEIEKCIKTEEPTVSNLSSMINQIEEKFSFIDKQLDIFKNQQFNQKVNVHVGGGLIVTYNDLKLMEDICTDMLQNELNDGWRIIAVCVQPEQRRPDYILGRFNPEKDCCETSAKRK